MAQTYAYEPSTLAYELNYIFLLGNNACNEITFVCLSYPFKYSPWKLQRAGNTDIDNAQWTGSTHY
jgi:hypothetical protein